ncbi:hypothetical protein B0H17DRAFT_1288729 [Mycena rosella]|uniref:Reverse transcriptase zinc-binding domain-containing protein n=1 Tax=Mycena rosella TaxID=1033263 RepID=A0AAD7FJP9_MYCRO|nr:hypothetical protein B0H17DRAFT_1288729 [Mycena rosella]
MSDSKYAIEGLTKNLAKWEDEGFCTVTNGDLMRLMGPSGIPGNKGADILAGIGAEKSQPDIIDSIIRPELTMCGAKLSAMTQKESYQHTLECRVAAGKNEEAPPWQLLWCATCHKDFLRSIHFFMWMLIHGGYKVGKYWDNIPGHQEKAFCPLCEEYESVDHILTQCNMPGREQIWDLGPKLWQLKTGKDLRPTMGMGEIGACGAMKHVSESAHLIWRIRNERVIQEKGTASEREVQNRWCKAIDNRLSLDCVLTNSMHYGKKSIKKVLVEKTWCRVLKDEDTLPKDWIRGTGVLVDIS